MLCIHVIHTHTSRTFRLAIPTSIIWDWDLDTEQSATDTSDNARDFAMAPKADNKKGKIFQMSFSCHLSTGFVSRTRRGDGG